MSQPLTIYYSARRFLLTAHSFVLDRRRAPYRRLAATLLIATRRPFHLEVGQGTKLTAQAALIAPKVLRRRLSAEHSDIAIIDVPMQLAEYRTIELLLRHQTVVSFEPERFAPLLPRLARAARGQLRRSEFASLHQAAVRLVGGAAGPATVDERIARVMAALDRMALDEVRLAGLARHVDLSPSRLRHLFCHETGSTISHYARWVAVWRAVNRWSPGQRWTEIAHACGFCDLAHLDHAFMEVFGLAPSTIFDPQQVRLVQFPEAAAPSYKPAAVSAE
ncbi:MAG: helix-turn-helix transcriptional regulator [Gammaproteobacteria bacterium]|nr:helix-turn-helix transcriptional regulator [Gammaproteobacteria bacterium]